MPSTIQLSFQAITIFGIRTSGKIYQVWGHFFRDWLSLSGLGFQLRPGATRQLYGNRVFLPLRDMPWNKDVLERYEELYPNGRLAWVVRGSEIAVILGFLVLAFTILL